MSEEEISQTEDIIKKKIDKNDSSNMIEESEQNDIMEKVNKESKKVKKTINSNNIKIFQKYQNLSIKELHVLLSQKNDDLIKLNEEKEKSKKILSDLLIKLNNTIQNNSEFLYDEDIDTDLILNLEKIKEDKKKQLDNSKKINNLFKSQLSSIKSKIISNEKVKKKMNLIDNKIDNLKKKNIFLKKEINEIKSKKAIQDKELEIISDNKKYPLKIQLKTEEMNNFSSQKHNYYVKLSMSMKSLDNVIKEIKRFDEMYNRAIKEDTDENIVKKINFWMNLIKSDLSGEKNDILNKIETGKSKFLNEIKNRNENNLYSNYNTVKDVNNTEESVQKINNTENDANKNNVKILNNKIIINKNKSSSLLFSNFNKNTKINKRNKISPLYISSNSSGNNLDTKKTLFKKLNYLKINTPPNGMKIRLKSISNKESNNFNNKGNNYFISEEINETAELNKNNYNNIINDNNDIENNNENDINNIQSNPNNNNEKINKELNDILISDYNEISDEEYRELLNKKEQYLESNLRLEKHIIENKRTKYKKISNIFNHLKETAKNLENLKLHNNLIEKEINNLYNVFQLTVEQAKLQNELNQKKNNKLKFKLKKEVVKNEENNLIKSSEIIPKNKNKNIEDIDLIIPKKKEIKSIEVKSSKKKKKKKETRDEQLKMIKEKYKDENNLLNDENHIKEIEKDNNEEGFGYEYKNDIGNNNDTVNDINNEKINNVFEEENKDKNEDNFEIEPL